MGVYDMLPKGSQVKCWGCEMKTLHPGDAVGNLGDESDYIVLLREGGIVQVKNGIIVTIIETRLLCTPKDFWLPVFDKWGNRVKSSKDLEGKGLLPDEPYYSEGG